jgi:hypothetical protein
MFKDLDPMTKFASLAAAAFAALSVPAQAQDMPAPAQGAPQANLRGNWLQADQTRSQAQQRAEAMFQRLDANDDGTLTTAVADAAAQMPGQGGIGGRGGKCGARLVERLFAGSDSASQAQFEAQALQRFDRQDLNHDGTVTGDERQQARAARQDRQGRDQ